MDTAFRTASPVQETVEESVPVELGDAGNQDQAIGEKADLSQESELDKWETQHGKYGLEYLGIKEIAKEFPYNADFSTIDKFIKETIKERGYSASPQRWQEVLAEIENEIGTQKLNAIDRLRKIANYAKVIKKINQLKQLKDSYRSLSSGGEL